MRSPLNLFRHSTCLIFLFLTIQYGQAAMPNGPTPPALTFPHFPHRMYTFVWRNWNLVPPQRLASVLGTSEANVRKLAAGLGCAPETDTFHGDRIVQTLIRRNWHLLPVAQLLTLLDWTETQLAHCLREHDFFWIKLGRLKPRCDELVYSEPSESMKKRARVIARIVRGERQDTPAETAEVRFAFLKQFEKAPAAFKSAEGADTSSFSIRYLYSYAAVFGDPLLNPALDPYPDGYLARLASLGVNGVWLHVVLRTLAPGRLFPEETENAVKRLENLKALVARAKRYGIGVYLYFNEPRAQDSAFFARHPAVRGVNEGDLSALCTSTEAVKTFLREGTRTIFSAVPDLAGFFTITGSENLTHCWSHGRGAQCPRCSKRGAGEVIAEVNRLLAEGAWEAQPAAEVIVWDWGWADSWVEPIVSALPKRCRLMSVSEWRVPISRGGVKSAVGEYSMSAIGPGPRALSHWKCARKHGLRTMAKVQVNNTWELSPVPFIPVPANVAEHLHRLRQQGLSGLMLSWSLGGYPSVNLKIVQQYCGSALPSVDDALHAAARDAYGLKAAPVAVKAWKQFSRAFAEFPFHIGVLYSGPQQMGPANLLYITQTGYHATMTGIPYDDLDRWRAVYPPEVFQKQFQKLSDEWEKGVSLFRGALDLVSEKEKAVKDLGVARAAGLHFESVANQAAFIRLRRALKKAGSKTEKKRCIQSLRTLCEKEIEAARALYRIARRDSRIGFEAANQYFYLPQDLLEKMINCRWIEEQLHIMENEVKG